MKEVRGGTGKEDKKSHVCLDLSGEEFSRNRDERRVGNIRISKTSVRLLEQTFFFSFFYTPYYYLSR